MENNLKVKTVESEGLLISDLLKEGNSELNYDAKNILKFCEELLSISGERGNMLSGQDALCMTTSPDQINFAIENYNPSYIGLVCIKVRNSP